MARGAKARNRKRWQQAQRQTTPASIPAREPNGRIQRPTRAETAEDVMATAIEGRMRVHGLSRAFAETRSAGTAVGRVLRQGGASKQQIEELLRTAERFNEVWRAYRVAIAAPPHSKSASDFDRTGGFDADDGTDEAYIERCNDARRAGSEAYRMLKDAHELAPWAAVKVIVDDRDLPSHVGPLMAGLNALARLWKIGRWARR